MGRRTWESIPKKFRPLPGRLNVVLSRSEVDAPLSATSLEDAYAQLEQRDDVQDIFIIGGGQVYKEALEKGLKRIIYTQVEATVDCDTFFPELADSDWVKKPYYHEDGGEKENGEGATSNSGIDSKSGLAFSFWEYTRRNHEELQYLNLCRDILNNGIQKGDRTGTGTLSQFGTQMRFSLRDGRLPLLTTKRTFWRGVAEELLRFISVRPID